MGSISKNWKALSGENNWEGLLDPLDIDLRRSIIHYGERAVAIVDGFNNDKDSKAYGFSLYPMKDFFSKVCLEKGNPFKYKMTSFIYARSKFEIPIIAPAVEETSWIAYVAVATDEGKTALGRRDILICWRGTMTDIEKGEDLEIDTVDASPILGPEHNPRVHRGFYSIYTTNDPNDAYTKASARDQVTKEVKKLVEKYRNEEVSITITGHSLGSGLATLNAVDIVANKHNRPTSQTDKVFPVTAIVFASPRVGLQGFADVFNELQVKDKLHILKISNLHDPVPQLPLSPYVPVGEELVMDTTSSPYITTDNPIDTVHNVEVYVHGVAGTQGVGNEFKLSIYRDLKLANKFVRALKDDSVPVDWWKYIKKANAMTQLDDGNWVLDYMPDPPKFDENDE